jgi:RimJ/RimL family protein N-acetyltransferase
MTLSFDHQPTLKGGLVELRPLRADDFPALHAVAADPLIWEQHPVRDRYEEKVFRGFFDEQLASGGALVAIDARTGDVIGMSRFHGYDDQRSEIEIGWTFLARSHWGGVYNREMKRLMLRHAFRFVRSVVFLVHPQNIRSQRAVEKIGGALVGSRLDGDGRQSAAYQIDISTFKELVWDIPAYSRRSRVPASTEPDVTGTPPEGTGHDNVGRLYEDR